MKKLKKVVLGLIIVGTFIFVALLSTGSFKPKLAGLSIKTDSPARVFVNGEEVGITPHKLTREEGEVTVKLVPEAMETPLSVYETRVKLTSGIETIINREFGETEELSSGTVISFEKLKAKESSMAIISIPDASQVSVDGFVRGFTPFKSNSVVPADHEIKVSAPGYIERADFIKTVEGYKLTAIVKLAKDESIEKKEEEERKENEENIEIEILDTPTGFLRVRSEPSVLGEEVAQVEPGEKYLLLEEDGDTGWYKIDSSPSGWITDSYSKIIED